ncbi:MAG: FIST signal transduction protein [Saprospiraceae bacterium]
MNTRPIYAESTQELEEQIKALQSSFFTPTLGIIFSSPKHDLNVICNLFDQADIDLFGCSTAGEILFSEIHDEQIVGVFMDIKKENYKIISKPTDGKIYETAFEMGLEVKNTFDKPAVMLASGGITIDAEKIVEGLEDSIQKNIPIFGGLAGDDLALTQTYSLSRDGAEDGGLVFIIFNTDKVSIEGLATSGWEAIGNVHTITKAEGNVVYTIDDKPALDVFINYFGYFDNFRLDGNDIETMSAQYPLQILREGDYNVLRSPLIGDKEERTLILAGGVKQGDQFKFSISPGFEVIDQTIKEFGGLQKKAPETELMVLFSCKGRHAALGPLIEDEITGLNKYWDAPLIGFFSYGEFGNVKNGKCDFHNETCSLVLIKEK